MAAFLQLSRPVLVSLATALETGRLHPPFTISIIKTYVPEILSGGIVEELNRLNAMGATSDHIAYTLRLLAAERSASQEVHDRVELVWTGQEVVGSQSRDTSVVVRELFSTAKSSILISSFAVDKGKKAQALFGVLASRMNANLELNVRMFLNVKRSHNNKLPESTLLKEFADTFRKEIWTGQRLPEVFYDPRSLAPGAYTKACLHAKCVVVDEERLLTKKLASFNCDQKMWEQFIARCNSKGTTATATLTQFIEFYLDDSLDDSLDDLDAIGGNDLDKRVDSRIKVSVEEYLDKYLEQRVEEYLASFNDSTAKEHNQTILAICSRLDKLESQNFGESNSNETGAIHNLADLEQKIEGTCARMTQFAEAIIKIQNYLNNQPKRRNKSYNNNSYYQAQTPRIQPLTEEGLASRLGVNVETIREQLLKLHPPLFVAWCKGKDRSGMGWEFNENTGLYHPAS